MHLDQQTLSQIEVAQDFAIVQVLPPRGEQTTEAGVIVPDVSQMQAESIGQMAARHVPILATVIKSGPLFIYDSTLIVISGGNSILPTTDDQSFKLIRAQDVIGELPQQS